MPPNERRKRERDALIDALAAMLWWGQRDPEAQNRFLNALEDLIDSRIMMLGKDE